MWRSRWNLSIRTEHVPSSEAAAVPAAWWRPCGRGWVDGKTTVQAGRRKVGNGVPSVTSHPLTIHTVGHSNLTEEQFIELLRAHGITLVVDTRSSPYSKYTPQFNQEGLRAAVREAEMEYLFLGKELGGRPQGGQYYDREGRVLYHKVAESGPFASGLARILDLAGAERLVLLCSEENPSLCHRRLLITRVLADKGAEVLHIRGDGRIESERELREREEAERAPGGAVQQSLFDYEETQEWKSIQSVLPRRPPSSFSEP